MRQGSLHPVFLLIIASFVPRSILDTGHMQQSSRAKYQAQPGIPNGSIFGSLGSTSFQTILAHTTRLFHPFTELLLLCKNVKKTDERSAQGS